jgi:tetraacyldisaccharide 4'-kinase
MASLLAGAGERPSILSRGYGRTRVRDGVVVVSDAVGMRAPLDQSGDEPFMLARTTPGCAVVVAADRHLAGVLAESRLGCTVHLLDDGFQHLALARDVDLLLLRASDLEDRPLPAGWLREPIDAAVMADAWLIESADAQALSSLAGHRHGQEVFSLDRRVGRPVLREAGTTSRSLEAGTRVLLVSGIAAPDRFEADIQAQGLVIVDHVRFRDHHPYRGADVELIARRASRSGAETVVTTEKDFVRLEPLRPLPFALAVAELRLAIAEREAFEAWLLNRLAVCRRDRAAVAHHAERVRPSSPESQVRTHAQP